jgi:RIO-like serine/threonine protein kinase
MPRLRDSYDGAPMAEAQLLKKDLFGEVRHQTDAEGGTITRDTRAAPVWTRWLARALMRREARVLAALSGIDGIPALLAADRSTLARRYLPGRPLYESRPATAAFYRESLRLLAQVHRHNVVHNDLAKEPNILVRPDGSPAFIDFQVAWAARRRGRLFRVLAYEDLRHLLKHKRTYCADRLSARQRAILARPSVPSRFFRRTLKPAYLFVTRRVLGWADREGAADRGRHL